MKVILSCSVFLLLSGGVFAVDDPTRPDLKNPSASTDGAEGQVRVKASDKFKLRLIKSDRGQRMALVDGRTLKEGDVLEGYTVLKITDQDVVLEQANERVTLSLFKAMKIQ